jgi:hypothetical protein
MVGPKETGICELGGDVLLYTCGEVWNIHVKDMRVLKVTYIEMEL